MNVMGDPPEQLAARPTLTADGRPTVEAEPRRRSVAALRTMDAGIRLFSESGFLATTIRDITGACGLTAAAFYNHFESKETLLHAVISEANAQLQADLEALAPTDDRAARLVDLVRTLVLFNLTHPPEARVANREYIFLEPTSRATVIDHRRRVRGLFEAAVTMPNPTPGLPHLSDHPDGSALESRLLAISIINLCVSSAEWYAATGELSMDELADVYCQLALRMAGMSTTSPSAA